MTIQNENPKKSETLEFRLSYEEKSAFLARAAQDGRSASEILRQLVIDFSAPAKPKRISKRWAFAGVFAALGLVAAPVLADRTLFAAFDVDGNGRIMPGEISAEGDREIIAALDTNKNGWLSFLELKASGTGETVSEQIDDFNDGMPKRFLELSFVVFELKRDRSVEQKVQNVRVPIAMDATPEQVARIQEHARRQLTMVQKRSGQP
jgi:hypothetical protein